jgi:polysaccharide pyruvyl transferase WcaK-like protein
MSIRVLCLGAYANGNVGDMYQAEAMASAILAVRPDAEIVSISPSARGSSYPARNHTAGPVDAVFDHDYMNKFDVMLVGGGGLFSAPHRPLNDPAWVGGLKLQVSTVAAGAAGETPQGSKEFLQKCRHVSVRDEYSLAAVSEIRPDSEIIMDPILLHGPRMRPPVSTDKRRGILWLPGKLVPGTMPYYDDLMLRLYNAKTDIITSVNPETDRRSGFAEVFGDDVRIFDSAEKFQQVASEYVMVVSERYHGCILAMTANVPCVGLGLRSRTVTSKIDELFRRVGYPKSVVPWSSSVTRQSLRGLATELDFDKINTYLDQQRDLLQKFVARCLTI